MKRTATGFCVAAVFGCIATLGAQTPPPAGQRTATSDKAREVTITGCLSKGADGKFMLTNARVDDPMGGSTTTGTSGTTTAGTTAGTTTPPAGTMNQAPAMSWALAGGTDLDKHVGHKVQVTGKTAWTSMDHGKMPDTTTATAGTTAGTVGTSGTTSTTATEEQRKDPMADQPRVDVQSVKMIASTCS
jgi:hypothetical protein